jgi:Protein of unknown function (DUF2892)
MQKNIDIVDQYLRLVSGTIALVSALQTRRSPLAQTALTTYGAMKVAEGVTGWCPIMYALGIRSTAETPSSKKETPSSAKRSPSSTGQEKHLDHSTDRSHIVSTPDTTYTLSETDSLNTTYQ